MALKYKWIMNPNQFWSLNESFGDESAAKGVVVNYSYIEENLRVNITRISVWYTVTFKYFFFDMLLL